jgi:hypothetical protein
MDSSGFDRPDFLQSINHLYLLGVSSKKCPAASQQQGMAHARE